MHRQGLHVGLSYGLGLEICVGQVDFFNTFSAHRRNYPSRHMMTAWATCDRARTACETCDRARTVSGSDTSAAPPHGHQCQPCRPCAHNLGSPMMCAQSSCALHLCRRCTHVHPWDTSLQQNGWVYQNGCVFLRIASTLRLAGWPSRCIHITMGGCRLVAARLTLTAPLWPLLVPPLPDPAALSATFALAPRVPGPGTFHADKGRGRSGQCNQ